MSGNLIWITGAGGLIGRYLIRSADAFASQWKIRPLDRAALDITDVSAMRSLFAQEKPSAVIHCAAISKTPACQKNPTLAKKVNVDATATLAGLAADIPLVFFSSDLVFDGRKGNYDETASVNPLTVYSETKVAAEQIVLRNPRHTVIRASLNAGISPTGDRGFNEETRQAWESGKILTLFADEFRSPLAAVVTARAVWELLAQDSPGLYHLAGSERLSRWELGQLLAARWPHLQARMEPGSIRSYSGPPRPPDTSLNCTKIQRLLSFRLPGFRGWLRENPNEPL